MTKRKGYLDGCIHFPTWLIYSDSHETAVEPVHPTKKKEKKGKRKNSWCTKIHRSILIYLLQKEGLERIPQGIMRVE